MSEKNLKIRNQFANKLIIKIEKLNNDIKLLAKVDKKLSNGNNQIGGGPSIQTTLRDAQFQVANVLHTIRDHQPNIDAVIRTNDLNKEANRELKSANKSLIKINDAIQDLAASIALIRIMPIPSIEQFDSEIVGNLKNLVGNEEVIYNMVKASKVMETVNKMKKDYVSDMIQIAKDLILGEFHSSPGVLHHIKKEAVKYFTKLYFNYNSLQVPTDEYHEAWTYYRDKNLEFESDFQGSLIYEEYKDLVQSYIDARSPGFTTYEEETENHEAKRTAYNLLIKQEYINIKPIITAYILQRKANENAVPVQPTVYPDIPKNPYFRDMDIDDTFITPLQTRFNGQLDDYFNAYKAYQELQALYDLDNSLDQPEEPDLPQISTLLYFGDDARNFASVMYKYQVDTTSGNTYNAIIEAHKTAMTNYQRNFTTYQAELAAHQAELAARADDPSLPSPRAAPIEPVPPPALTIPEFNASIHGPDEPIRQKSLREILTECKATVTPYANLTDGLKSMFTESAYNYRFPSDEAHLILSQTYEKYQEFYTYHLNQYFDEDKFINAKTLYTKEQLAEAQEAALGGLGALQEPSDTLDNLLYYNNRFRGDINSLGITTNEEYIVFLNTFKYIRHLL